MFTNELAIEVAKKLAWRILGGFYVLAVEDNWLIAEDESSVIQFIWTATKDVEDVLTPPSRHEAEVFASNWINSNPEKVDDFHPFRFKFAVIMLSKDSYEVGKAQVKWIDPTNGWPKEV